MRIGIVCYPTFGGSGVVATELGLALAEEGHTVHFITYDRPVRLGTGKANVIYHEVRVSDYPLFDYQPYELVLTSKLVDVVKHERLDLLHVHYAIPHASAAWMAQQILAAQGIRIPFITTLHGTDITLVGRDASFEPVITFAIEHSDAVTAVSESLRKDTYAHFPMKRAIEVIPNFICPERYGMGIDPVLRKRFAPNGEKLLVHVSNFRPVKRVQDVLAVFMGVREQMPVRLLLIGDGPDRHLIEAQCRANGTCDEVFFLGKMTDPEEVVASCDLFLLTSEAESFGLAALEAMACGVPVVSTDAGGTAEVVEDGVSGLLNPIGDTAAMTANALSILKDPETLARFRKGAARSAERFDIAKVLPRYEALYQQVVDQVKANGVHQ
ncbi:MAG: N-acetyl-alpha-D-glucosaminyl L-malate synthase BshA [Flavobacteriales bacterium]|nr:N-acetyl-alpha-D-glucosaminyl L-malate synthase BshA [Flavobacteriales bacterium]MBK9598403.1 N-acetyl-alpha-D-glucosaminyl L-malate synthase BshA [Flavobacteriales bacterium]QQS73313.1 MAG: N-acetyl-alpha-D-glucosaminyl L-malate synthase BshA [Flavobacteriales bacterium]HQV37997.1 N-acetyl-alpha-D-glucosaminyl L-malate synthase BshA [Flavobacteriales bacterium]HQW32295.1 N-acetyl-alpha-D-glucosaminyl L-malate synthase BshA [Flavobacteriales bacterium]